MPHGRSLDGVGLEEERRLAYVAMTRAREVLVLTWAGSRDRRRRQPSRFLAESGCAGSAPPAVLDHAA